MHNGAEKVLGIGKGCKRLTVRNIVFILTQKAR